LGNEFKKVNDFHKAFGHPQADKPTEIEDKVALARSIWTGEELVEFLYATAGGEEDKFDKLFNEFMSGLNKAKAKTKEKQPDVSNKLVAQMDALTDVSYFNYGSFAVAGVDPEPLFDIVQEANMGKLWEDGKPRFRDGDGKIVKPPNWENDYAPEPRLAAEIDRQSK